MYFLTKDSRAAVDLVLSMAIAAILMVLNAAINFAPEAHGLLADMERYRATFWLINSLFFWLAALMFIAFLRWRAAARARAALETIISSISPDALVVINEQRTITMCNRSIERLLGYRPEELVGHKTDRLYFDRRTDNRRQGEIREALASDGFHVGRATGRRADGSTVPLEIISGLHGGRHGAVLLLRDISERLRAEERHMELETRIRQRQKLESLGMLASGMAHDFNNLLMVVMGSSDLVREAIPSESPALQNMQQIDEAVSAATTLCRQMLAYAGQGQLAMNPIDLSDVARGVTMILSSSLPKQATLDLELTEHPPLIAGDPAQIDQAMMCLITNAVESVADRTEGRITVRTGSHECSREFLRSTYIDDDLPGGTYSFFEIQDNGCGMGEKTCRELFDPFFTTKFKGRGLGLAAVLGIIRGHRGAVEVISREGEGTIIRVHFPAGSHLKRPSAPDEEPEWTGKGTILIVDDEEAVLFTAKRMVERLGFEVIDVDSGVKALELLNEGKAQVDAVLLDLMMPDLSGEDTLIQLRVTHPTLPVLMTSGYCAEDVVARFHDTLDGFIEKPYRLGVLRDALRDVLNHGAAVPGAELRER